MPLETYVARVVAGEAVRDSGPAALEALAITVRTFALANVHRHGADGFDLCDQTHCQVLRAATPATDSAAHATSGQVLLYKGAPAPVYFSASCGGRTEVPSNVWPGADDPPFLPSRDDDGCEGTPAWTASLSEEDLMRALRAAGFRGARLRDLRIASRNSSGRVARMKLDGLRPEEISGQDLRVAVGRTLGWQHIKSTSFDLRRQGDAYRFSGHGSGHGVGMCVIGSARLAERGMSTQHILARYFPGLDIFRGSSMILTSDPNGAKPVPLGSEVNGTRSVPKGSESVPKTADPIAKSAIDVLVSLPDDDEGERAGIERQVARARTEMARVLGVASPPKVTVRFHPTTDDYEQATGRAWFTSGATVNGELHLLPLAVLRGRGLLDRTLRHELVHTMADAVLSGRPAWVREGAAIFFAGEQPIPGETRQRPAFAPPPRASCPDDNDLLRPVSVGALSNAYARARSCFAKQIAAGKSWRDVH